MNALISFVAAIGSSLSVSNNHYGVATLLALASIFWMLEEIVDRIKK